jgi:dihydroxyacetone kinase-like protein
MNFDIAGELAGSEGIETRTVRIWDDVASAPNHEMRERRGIAGDLFVIKVAGGIAAHSQSLEEVYRVASKARDRVRSMGVALGAGSLPETGEPTFELGEDEIEIGMGLHGEPGVSREKMLAADTLVERMMNALLEDMPLDRDDRVCLLINDLGATTMLELLVVNRKAHDILDARGVEVYDTLVGDYCTSQEMAGFSISLMKLDDELQKFYDMPVRSLALVKR